MPFGDGAAAFIGSGLVRRGLLDGRDVGEGVDGLSDDERVVREELVETSSTSGSPGRQSAAKTHPP